MDGRVLLTELSLKKVTTVSIDEPDKGHVGDLQSMSLPLEGLEMTFQRARSLAADQATYSPLHLSNDPASRWMSTYRRRIDEVTSRERQSNEDGEVGLYFLRWGRHGDPAFSFAIGEPLYLRLSLGQAQRMLTSLECL